MNGWASKREKYDLTPEDFGRLLAWLDPDPDRAGERYEEIRSQLIRILISRGCRISEDLADETMNRVARKLGEIESSYVGDPARYFYGVVQMVFHEYLRAAAEPRSLPEYNLDREIETRHECLDECLKQLPPRTRRLILEYYSGDGQNRIARRQRLARGMKIGLNALRLRTHRIKETLHQCIRDCLKQRLEA